jgi:GDPmannose 4,6-dehydratase
MRRSLVIGINGQDGRLISESLQRDGYAVSGATRERVQSAGGLEIGQFNLAHANEVERTIHVLQPDEIYYLAAFHHSSEQTIALESGEVWEKSLATHLTGLVHVLEAVRKHSRHSRLFYAASSHVFGQPPTELQDEQTPFNPTCIYGITKAAGVQCCRYYRKEHSLFATAGILYNHESHLRAEKFLSQKIVQAAWRIKNGTQSELVLGDLSARVDWGYAVDYVRAMRMILALDTAEDFVIATGELHTVGEFAEIAFGALGLDWKNYVNEKPGLLARRKVNLCGNPTKLKSLTGWKPSVSFEEMIRRLIKDSHGN